MKIYSKNSISHLFTKLVRLALIASLLLEPNITLAVTSDIDCDLSIDCEEKKKVENSIKDFAVVNIALEALKVNRQAYLNNFWTTLGFFSLALGWMLTSKETKLFFCNEPKNKA